MRQHDHRYRGVRVGQAGLVSVDGRPLPVTLLATRLAPDGYDWGSRTTVRSLSPTPYWPMRFTSARRTRPTSRR